ncbi:GNAT family N-acetyltransferase [Thalassococcus profundi]|uniref:GNAT family N-acetyltransferase n=1 Tax=Thalassococcus profundi TaxID=2282382 RepID=A0A369TWI4_9RHOB|nr:GNAT family N-acetyltransferase [Thalassococcus profundi]RDD67326.1 GNAT family N-acetyltransferase [Thalassococcus profundi]
MLDQSPVTQDAAARSAPQPVVDVIDAYEAFEALRPAWNALFARDPEATLFLSWAWLAEGLSENPRRWRIFVARNPHQLSQIVAVLPLRLRVHWSREREEFTTECDAAGRLLHSLWTGLLCDPDWEEAAMPALARAVAQTPWTELSLRYVRSTRRAEAFAAAFDPAEFRLSWKTYTVNAGATDNLVAPRLVLPLSFETWLQTAPSRGVQDLIRRTRRRYLDSGRWTLTRSDADTHERDREALLALWVAERGVKSGSDEAQALAEGFRSRLDLARRLGCLDLSVLWDGDTPVGAVAHLLDHDMDRMHLLLMGRDPGDAPGAPELILIPESIRWGIDQGFDRYEFGAGDQPWKFAFGAQRREMRYFALRRRAAPRAFALDRLCLPDAVERVAEMVRMGKTERAQQGLDQLKQLV